MNIGRRQFLKFIGVATAGIAVDPLALVIQNESYYVNKKLGFGFVIPDKWQIRAFHDFGELKTKQILPDLEGYSSEELVSELSDGLVAVLHKYPNLGEPMFSPGITFFMSPSEVIDGCGNLEDFVHFVVNGFEIAMKDYEVKDIPMRTKGKNFEAYRFKAKYLFEAEGIKSTLIDDETLIIEHDGILYTIHMYDSPYTNEGCSSELTCFKNSLHIA